MKAGNRKILVAAIIAAFFLVMAAVLLNMETLPALTLLDHKGQELAKFPLEHSGFIHHYIHSIHKTPVDEEFIISGSKLELVRVRYDSYGVGMPSDGGEAFRLEDNRFVVDMHRSFTQIDISVSHLADHGVSIDGSFHPFTAWVPKESSITLKAGEMVQFFSRRKAHQ
jgi:hypothetical protein